VIALCLLYFVLLAGAQLYLWWRTMRDGERPRWMVEVSGVLACTPEEAFALVGDPRNDARYAPQVVAVALDAPGGPREGTTYRETIRIGPTTRTLGCTITAYDPPHAIGTRATLGSDNHWNEKPGSPVNSGGNASSAAISAGLRSGRGVPRATASARPKW